MEFNTLTLTLNNFIAAFSAGYGNLLPSINWLIGTLLAVEIVLIGFWWALNGNDQLIKVIKKILYIGFWMWLVTNFPGLAQDFVNSLIDAGLIAGGQTGNHALLMDPSRIAGYGIDATAPLTQAMDNVGWDIIDAVIIGISYLLIIIAFFIIAWQVFFAILEFYASLAYLGILMPFGFLSYTKFLAEKAIGYVIANGIKLMVLAFIVAVAEPVLSNISFASNTVELNEIWSVFLTSWAIAILAWNAPGKAAGILAGSPSLSAGTGLQNTIAGAYLGAQGAAAGLSATRAAASASGAVGAGATRLAGNVSTGYKRGSAYTQGGSAAKVAGGIKGAGESLARSAYGKISSPIKNAVSSNFQKGASSSYQSMTGSTTDSGSSQGSAKSNSKPAPGWAQKMLHASHNIPQEARPMGGNAQPKL